MHLGSACTNKKSIEMPFLVLFFGSFFGSFGSFGSFFGSFASFSWFFFLL